MLSVSNVAFISTSLFSNIVDKLSLFELMLAFKVGSSSSQTYVGSTVFSEIAVSSLKALIVAEDLNVLKFLI